MTEAHPVVAAARRARRVGRIFCSQPGGGWAALRRISLGLVFVVALGNLGILGLSMWARHRLDDGPVRVPAAVAAIHNFEAVDEVLWRGGAPSEEDLAALASAGVTTVVDLRAEDDLDVASEALEADGLTRVAIPVRDGQAPSPAKVARFLEVVRHAQGRVYVHCGAGVGRTGTMVAAYRVAHGQSGRHALIANLAVGPPSLEQLAFAASLSPGGTVRRPDLVVVAASRVLDAPRRGWKVLEGLF